MSFDINRLSSLRQQAALNASESEKKRQQEEMARLESWRESQVRLIMSQLPTALEETARSGAGTFRVYCTREGPHPLGGDMQPGDKEVYKRLVRACRDAGIPIRTKWCLEYGCCDIFVDF